MRELFLSALFAICLAFPVKARTTPLFNHQLIMSEPITNAETVGRVISYLVIVHNYDAAILYGMHGSGNLIIERAQQGYQVTIYDASGGATIIILTETF